MRIFVKISHLCNEFTKVIRFTRFQGMLDKEFIKKQTDNFLKPLSEEQFMTMSEYENSIIILKLPFHDYLLTDIAHIVESNNAHVFALSVLPVSDGNTLLVSIKLNIADLTPVLRSFERFNYSVIYHYTKEGEVSDTQKERLEELMYYLEM